MGSGSGGHSMKGFFEKPPASSTVHSNTCPAPIYYPVPSTPPTLFLQVLLKLPLMTFAISATHFWNVRLIIISLYILLELNHGGLNSIAFNYQFHVQSHIIWLHACIKLPSDVHRQPNLIDVASNLCFKNVLKFFFLIFYGCHNGIDSICINFMQGNSPHDFYRESVYSMSNLSRVIWRNWTISSNIMSFKYLEMPFDYIDLFFIFFFYFFC